MPQKSPDARREYDTKYYREVWYPAHKEQVKLANKARQVEIREWVQQYKLERGCADCGYNEHYAALDFDHLGDKEFGIKDRAGRGYSKATLLAEMEKCDVVCANCHRIRTLERMPQ